VAVTLKEKLSPKIP